MSRPIRATLLSPRYSTIALDLIFQAFRPYFASAQQIPSDIKQIQLQCLKFSGTFKTTSLAPLQRLRITCQQSSNITCNVPAPRTYLSITLLHTTLRNYTIPPPLQLKYNASYIRINRGARSGPQQLSFPPKPNPHLNTSSIYHQSLSLSMISQLHLYTAHQLLCFQAGSIVLTILEYLGRQPQMRNTSRPPSNRPSPQHHSNQSITTPLNKSGL